MVILHQIASKRSTTCLYVLGTLQMTRSMLENIGFRFAQSQSVLAVFTMGIASKTAFIETYFAGHRKHCRFVFTLLIPCLDTPPNIMTNEWVVQELDFGRAFLCNDQKFETNKNEFGQKKSVTERPPESICITKTNSETKYFSFDFFSLRFF